MVEDNTREAIEDAASCACRSDGEAHEHSSFGSDEDSNLIMMTALRCQIRGQLHEEHEQEVRRLKAIYEEELRELRADIKSMQAKSIKHALTDHLVR
jgi:hypothetical protein